MRHGTFKVTFLCAVLIAIAAIAAWRARSSPGGCYAAPASIALQGDSFWRLRDGRVEFVSDGGSESFGTYTQSNGLWFWDNSYGHSRTSRFRIGCGISALTVLDDSTGQVERWPRRFWPFLLPERGTR